MRATEESDGCKMRFVSSLEKNLRPCAVVRAVPEAYHGGGQREERLAKTVGLEQAKLLVGSSCPYMSVWCNERHGTWLPSCRRRC